MLDSIVVTLAAGRSYADSAALLLGPLVRAGNAALAVTDHPEAFAGLGVETLPWQPELAHVWHSKRHAVRAGLERAQTAYFLDADHEIRPNATPPLLPHRLSGFHGRFWRLPLQHIRLLGVGPTTSEPVLGWLNRAAEIMQIDNWQRRVLWWGDSAWAISRDEEGAWLRFCQAWDRFAAWAGQQAPPHPLILGDGVAMAFSACADGAKPHFGLLEPGVLAAFEHREVGTWRKNLHSEAAWG